MNSEEYLVSYLKEHNLHLATAESCTGGMLISTIINASGASNVINQSFVTYSIDAKKTILGVSQELIDQYGVASIEVAKAMVLGLRKKVSDEVLISVTGFAGGNANPLIDGLCFYAIMFKDEILELSHIKVDGNRNEARGHQTIYLIERTYELLKNRIGA